MTKQVLISISGLQFENEEESPVEVITAGEYYFKNGKHYVVYNEVQEGFTETTRNMIRIQDSMLEITKKGLINVNMLFEKNKKNTTFYETPFGNIMVGLLAKEIDITETESRIHVEVEYLLEMNYEPLADYRVVLDIMSKTAENFSLQ